MLNTLAPNLIELLETRARSQPERTAYVFLREGLPPLELSYEGLFRRVRNVAGWLQARGLHGQRVLLLLPTGLDFVASFLGCLAAGVTVVPAPPPAAARLRALQSGASTGAGVAARFLSRTAPPLSAIATSAGIAGIIATEELCDASGGFSSVAPDLAAAFWFPPPVDDDASGSLWVKPEIAEQATALLQYTSGSTSTPKGVIVTHRNIISNCEMLRASCEISPEEVSVTWLPNYHDMGLIDGILLPLYAGIPGVLLSPTTFLSKPIRWLAAISEYRGTHSGGPNFAYDLCVQKISHQQCTKLDLSCWRMSYNGAEPIRSGTIQRFVQKFSSVGFRREQVWPCFGLAEATLFVSGGPIGQGPREIEVRAESLAQHRVEVLPKSSRERRHTLVASGRAAPELEIVIADPRTRRRLSPGRIGEIWVRGASVAAGYYGQPEATHETFGARLEGEGEATYMRTGDLGFSFRGDLYVTGRLKDVIIVNGRNLYPQDIEATVESSHSLVRPTCVAAFSASSEDEDSIVVVFELENSSKISALDSVFTAIRESVALEFDLALAALVVVGAGSMPKTSSGKIQRSAIRQAYLDQELDVKDSWRRPRLAADGQSVLVQPSQ
jgi:acyl-CoA synthetase (AMP-forming)/AMP-acid ligase II